MSSALSVHRVLSYRALDSLTFVHERPVASAKSNIAKRVADGIITHKSATGDRSAEMPWAMLLTEFSRRGQMAACS